MKAHVQNPWTRKPTLMINMSVEHVQQLRNALAEIDKQFGSEIDANMEPNQLDALAELRRTLSHALNTALPHGIKDVTP